jgi:hypothetical protein
MRAAQLLLCLYLALQCSSFIAPPAQRISISVLRETSTSASDVVEALSKAASTVLVQDAVSEQTQEKPGLLRRLIRGRRNELPNAIRQNATESAVLDNATVRGLDFSAGAWKMSSPPVSENAERKRLREKIMRYAHARTFLRRIHLCTAF